MRRRRPLLLLGASVAVTLAAAVHGAGCAQQSTTVPVRSLEGSGRVSFVCLGPPGAAGTAEHPLGDCTSQLFTDINEYLYEDDAGDIDAGSGQLPHLYALVTQTKRGEVAVIDTSSTTRPVLDENPVEPGANFLPIGAQPTGIVSTPGSIASFVGVAEIGRAGIFALPSSLIRPSAAAAVGGQGGGGAASYGFNASVPQLTSWPACALPAAPGDIILINDPKVGGLERPSCDDDYAPVNAGDLISSVEGQGRQKLVFTIPDLGGIAVMDAQALLNQAPGSFDACPVERWLPLEVDLTGVTPPKPPEPPPGAACVYPRRPEPDNKPPYTARPGGISYADGKLYVADLAAPVIHVVEMPTPCEPLERTPLTPYSAEDPKRVVTTSRVAVSPAETPDYKRYLYATDIDDGSLMVFDVGPNATSRRPLVRKNAATNPFQARDRIKYGAPAADILIVQRDTPETNPVTGLAVAGVRCDPDPSKVTCTETSTSCDIAVNYRTDTQTYLTGAQPGKLRGTFALAALTSGKVAVIDVDDLDAACRGPSAHSTLLGCADNDAKDLVTSFEQSCTVTSPNQPRSATFELSNQTVGSHVPALIDYPKLYDTAGALIEFADGPKMVPPKAPPGVTAGYTVWVRGEEVALSSFSDQPSTSTTEPHITEHGLGINYEDPRAHVIDDFWSVTFEGQLPNFSGRLSQLKLDGAPGIFDTEARFCDFGVQSEAAAREIHADLDKTPAQWARLADYVQINRELPDEMDPYWKNIKSIDPTCTIDGAPITFNDCQGIYGTVDAPTGAREFRIVEAYQDRVELRMRPVPPPPCGAGTQCDAGHVCVNNAGDFLCYPQDLDAVDLHTVRCCFPDALSFTVRGGDQWIVVGAQLGFLHHVVADPVSGACRNTCDAAAVRKNGRIIEAATRDEAADAQLFTNPMFRFGIQQGAAPSVGPKDRDHTFQFSTQGSFTSLLIGLSNDPAVLVQPHGLAFLPSTGEVAITDAAFNGLMFVSLASSTLSRSFF